MSETSEIPLPRRPIMKTGTRILRPQEWRQLHEQATFKDQLDTLLYTGMRYVEVQRLHDNPDWFQGKFVFLPKQALFKAKRLQQERWVILNDEGAAAISRFLNGKRNLPSWAGWSADLKRWAIAIGLDPIGLGPKTTRKTWESWLVTSYPNQIERIFLSQGHAAITSLKHYINMPFTHEENELMKPYVEGMF